jgi:hypothetical protein
MISKRPAPRNALPGWREPPRQHREPGWRSPLLPPIPKFQAERFGLGERAVKRAWSGAMPVSTVFPHCA